MFVCACVLSCVRLSVTPWTAAHQAPLSVGFPRQDTGVGCHFLLQAIFLTQGSNPSLCNLEMLYDWTTRETPYEALRVVKILDTESRMVVARGGGGGWWGGWKASVWWVCSFSFAGQKESWRWMVVMGTQHYECTQRYWTVTFNNG